MIAFSMRKLPDESIVICTIHRDWKTRRDIGSLAAELFDLLQRVKYPIYLVLDLTESALPSEDVLPMARTMARGQHMILNHANLRALLLVSTDPLAETLAGEMKAQALAYAPVSAYPDQPAALEQARSLMRL
jgi:hypothetical protein